MENGKEVRYVVLDNDRTGSLGIYDTSVSGYRCVAESKSMEDAELIVDTLNSRGELQALRGIVQALKDFGPPLDATALDVYEWLESTTAFVNDDTIVDQTLFSKEKAKVAEVFNSIEVHESDFTPDSPYILVEDNEENRSKLRTVGITDDQMDAAGDKEHFCLLALAFGPEDSLVNDFRDGKFV